MEKLTQGLKRELAKIIEEEFVKRNSLYQRLREQERERILENYKKSVGFSKLAAAYRRAQNALNQADNALLKVGLDADGSIRKFCYGDTPEAREGRQAIEKVKKLLNSIAENSPAYNLKTKVIAKLWLASTYEEARAILAKVLNVSNKYLLPDKV